MQTKKKHSLMRELWYDEGTLHSAFHIIFSFFIPIVLLALLHTETQLPTWACWAIPISIILLFQYIAMLHADIYSSEDLFDDVADFTKIYQEENKELKAKLEEANQKYDKDTQVYKVLANVLQTIENRHPDLLNEITREIEFEICEKNNNVNA